MAKPFKKWMADARREAKQGNCDKIGKLYEVMAKNNWKHKDLEDLFNNEWPDYELLPDDLHHLDILHDVTCLKWYLADTDY